MLLLGFSMSYVLLVIPSSVRMLSNCQLVPTPHQCSTEHSQHETMYYQLGYPKLACNQVPAMEPTAAMRSQSHRAPMERKKAKRQNTLRRCSSRMPRCVRHRYPCMNAGRNGPPKNKNPPKKPKYIPSIREGALLSPPLSFARHHSAYSHPDSPSGSPAPQPAA